MDQPQGHHHRRLLRGRPQPRARASSSRPWSPPTSARARPSAPPASATATASAPGGGSAPPAIGSLILAFTVGPRIRRIAAEHDLQTVGDYLEHRYGRTVRGASWPRCCGWARSRSSPGSSWPWARPERRRSACRSGWAASLGGAVMTAYFTAGGLLDVGLGERAAARGRARRLCRAACRSRSSPRGRLGRASPRAAPADPEYWSFWQGGASGVTYIALLGARLHRVARPAAEGLRRARRPHGAARRGAERGRAPHLRLHPRAARHRRARPASRPRRTTSSPCPRCCCATCRRSSGRSAWPPSSRPRSTPPTPSSSCCRRRCPRTSTRAT